MLVSASTLKRQQGGDEEVMVGQQRGDEEVMVRQQRGVCSSLVGTVKNAPELAAGDAVVQD